jgi:radical SAM superfamily enzyme YgiQ (UPF0313 family)
MKIIISYPPLSNEKGCPTLGQNRQFQYFKEPTLIYPVVPATAATLLKKSGFEVIWNDCLAKGWSYAKFLEFITSEKPDLIAFETKTPVIKQHWKIIEDIKGINAAGDTLFDRQAGLRSRVSTAKNDYSPKVVLFGDHVTALPEESFQNSKVDFVLTGGDYDFLLLNLCNFLSGKAKNLEEGIYYRDGVHVRNTGRFKLEHDLNSAPFIDRELTCWQDYAYKNGNYKRIPGTYIMSGRDCWWGKCTFCAWPALYPCFRSRSVENVLEEIGSIISRYGVREIMDDSGCFIVGDWLRKFCHGMVELGYNKKIYLDCNMRFGALTDEDYTLMKKANFRLLLFGLESANQKTLDRINKNLKVERIIEGCKSATKAGLFPHVTIMFGYPWETYEEACNTLKLGQWLLRKGYAYTMQATMVIPYPGSPLFEECKNEGWLKTTDWNNYDMKQPVMRTPFEDKKVMQLVQGMYRVSYQPEFILRKLSSLRDMDDLKYWMRAVKKVFGHILDFKR